jgi:hypothetical protein
MQLGIADISATFNKIIFIATSEETTDCSEQAVHVVWNTGFLYRE